MRAWKFPIAILGDAWRSRHYREGGAVGGCEGMSLVRYCVRAAKAAYWGFAPAAASCCISSFSMVRSVEGWVLSAAECLSAVSATREAKSSFCSW